MLFRGLTLCVLTVLVGCASDLKPESENPPDGRELPGPGGAQASFSKHEEGYYQAVVNATSGDWVYLDLDTQTQVTPVDPDSSDAWDIAHNGSDIKLNGGASGTPPGGGGVVAYAHKVAAGEDYPWLELTGAPPAGEVEYRSETSGGLLGGVETVLTTYPEADETANPLTGAGDHGWYHDSGFLAGNVITPRPNVAYIVRTLECRYISLRLTAYSNDAGMSGYPAYDLRELPGADCDSGGGSAGAGRVAFSASADGQYADVDASDEGAWVFVDLINAVQVQPSDSLDDATWDLGFRRSDVQMNGGASGTQDVALHDILRADWAALTQVPADVDWHLDTADALAFVTYPEAENTGQPACGGINGDHGWYYYSGFCNDGDGTHHISPRDVVYVLRGRDATYWKLRFLDYYDEAGNAARLHIEIAPLAP